MALSVLHPVSTLDRYWCLGLIRDVIQKEPYNILYLIHLSTIFQFINGGNRNTCRNHRPTYLFCRWLFVLLYFFFWPLCCLFFFYLWILITSLWYLQTLPTYHKSLINLYHVRLHEYTSL